MKIYSIKEIFYTLQGEGSHAGRPAVFCRFAGCNLWTGLERDREKAICQFCDTDFIGTDGPGGGKFYSPEDVAKACKEQWPACNSNPFIVMTGGEPMLQVDGPLIDALHKVGFEIAIETNGTHEVPRSIDWICVSPKAGAELVQRTGDELKLVYPQPTLLPETVETLKFTNYYLQPMDGDEQLNNISKTVEYCKSHPQWKLSLQTHKMIGIP